MDHETKPRRNDVPPSGAKRRPYRQPRLERFGTLTEITNNVGNMGLDDGGAMKAGKTSP